MGKTDMLQGCTDISDIPRIAPIPPIGAPMPAYPHMSTLWGVACQFGHIMPYGEGVPLTDKLGGMACLVIFTIDWGL
jgi:hypothetical protein